MAGTSRPYEGLLAAAPASEVDAFVALLRRAGLYPVVLDLGVAALYNAFRTLSAAAQHTGDYALINLSAQSADLVVVSEGAAPYARTVYARTTDWEPSLRYLIESVQDAFKYCEFKLRWRPVQRLYGTGSHAALAQWLARIQAETRIPVERWNPLERVQAGSGRLRRDLARPGATPPLAISLGLALRRYDDA
jgi:Tfp pilus assembly PilM family ATPase